MFLLLMYMLRCWGLSSTSHQVHHTISLIIRDIHKPDSLVLHLVAVLDLPGVVDYLPFCEAGEHTLQH